MVVLQGNKLASVNGTVVGSIPTRRNSIFNIFQFFALVTRHSVALSLATQHAMPREFEGKWR